MHFSAVLRHFVRLLVPGQTSLWAWTEVVLLTVLAYGASAWSAPNNPMQVGGAFTWIWLVPMVLALRYGVVPGAASIAMLFAGHYLWLYGWTGRLDLGSMPNTHFFGGLVFAFICGQFAEIWTFRVHRAREIMAGHEERLSTLTRDHYLLRLSHERVLQDMLVKPTTLRDSLAKIRGESLRAEKLTVPTAPDFLRFLGHLCQLETASLHAVIGGDVQVEPLARIGEPESLDLNDPLVRHAVVMNELAHVQIDAMKGKNPSRYLVCAPAIDSHGNPRCFLAIELMPFMALTTEGLQTLAVTLGYYADSLSMARIITPIRSTVPNVNAGFALELMRLTRVARETGLESAIAALTLRPTPDSRAVWEQLLRARRSLDVTWEITAADRYALITIMPLSGSAALESYLIRVERMLMERFGIDFEAGVVTPHTIMIDGSSPALLLQSFLARCNV